MKQVTENLQEELGEDMVEYIEFEPINPVPWYKKLYEDKSFWFYSGMLCSIVIMILL